MKCIFYYITNECKMEAFSLMVLDFWTPLYLSLFVTMYKSICPVVICFVFVLASDANS